MTTYAAVIVLALAGLAARGFEQTAAAIAAAVAVVGVLLDVSYVLRRERDRVLEHRRRLDRVVRLQLAAIAIAGSIAAVAIGEIEPPPLADAHDLVQTLILGIVVAAVTVFVSAMVDWYWVLPKVSGLVGLAPCERVGGEGFAGVTKIWFFHRAAATTIVTFVLAGVPGYMAGTTGGDGRASAAWVILGTALALGYNAVTGALTTAFRYAFNPQLFVGDVIRVRANPEDATLRDAYAVDVSIQGLKYVMLDDRPQDPCFLSKGALLRIEDIERTHRSPAPRQPCPDVASCRAVNWYCFRNPNAHAGSATRAATPVPWPREEPDRD